MGKGKKMKYNLAEMYIDDEIKNKVIAVLNSKRYIKGKEGKNFEEEFAEYIGTEYGIATNSGTSGLYLAYYALGLGKDDEIIVPSHTFIATVSTAMHLGIKPVFVDIDPETFTMNPRDVEKKITQKTKAIVPVHLYGHPVDMKPIIDLADENDLYVIEDAAQAHGSLYNNRKVGSIGDIAVFSFFPSKVMTVAGDGGMVVTNNKEIGEKIAMLRDQGRKEKYIHELLGFNFRLNEIQAAIGRIQLKHLEEWIEKRRNVAKLYNELLGGLDSVVPPMERSWARHVYYVYTIKAKNRDKLSEFLKKNGIATGLYYPVPVHKQPAIMKYMKTEYLPQTEKCVNEILSLPMYPELKKEQINYIVEKIDEYYNR